MFFSLWSCTFRSGIIMWSKTSLQSGTSSRSFRWTISHQKCLPITRQCRTWHLLTKLLLLIFAGLCSLGPTTGRRVHHHRRLRCPLFPSPRISQPGKLRRSATFQPVMDCFCWTLSTRLQLLFPGCVLWPQAARLQRGHPWHGERGGGTFPAAQLQQPACRVWWQVMQLKTID